MQVLAHTHPAHLRGDGSGLAQLKVVIIIPEPQDPVAVVTLPHHCSPNITDEHQGDGFCTHKPDGLYPRSESPHTFYRCVRRRTYVTRCHTHEAHAHNGGGVAMAMGGAALAGVAEAALLQVLLFVWGGCWVRCGSG